MGYLIDILAKPIISFVCSKIEMVEKVIHDSMCDEEFDVEILSFSIAGVTRNIETSLFENYYKAVTKKDCNKILNMNDKDKKF